MAEKKKVDAPEVKEEVKIDESDFNERVEGFGKEFQKLLGKYELGVKPTAVLKQLEGSEAYCIVPQMQIISDRKARFNEKKGSTVEKPESDLVEG